MKKSSLLLLFIFCANNLMAQQFEQSAKLSAIQTDGLHALLVSSDIRSFSKADLSDIRLFGPDNIEVPYYFWKESRMSSATNFEQFPIIAKDLLPNKSTIIIIENKERKIIDEIVLDITNSKLQKSCNINGSNDLKQWFGLIENYKINNLENPNTTHVLIPIKLPSSNYRYLKIQINDSSSAAIDILKLGVFKQSIEPTKLLSLKPAIIKFNTDNAEKKTFITIQFEQAQIIENIAFDISMPKLFKRNARIVANRKIIKNKKEAVLVETLATFELNSNSQNSFELPTLYEKEIIIEIENKDNPTLQIDSLSLAQIPVYLVAELKANKNYSLKTGDSNLMAPNYDITNFKENTITDLPRASFSEIKTMNNQKSVQNENASFWQQKWFMWLCIGIAVLSIFYFSSSLLKDMKK